MKFSNVALLASAAVAYDLNLEVSSDNGELNGKGIQSYHEGAGISYFGLSDHLGQNFEYDEEKKLLTQDWGQYTANVGVEANILQVGPAVSPSEVTFDSVGNLDIGTQLYACKNINDPYNYFTETYGIVAGEAPNDSCVKIGLRKIGAISSSTSAAPTSSAHGAWNTTVTDHVTVTGYTTYCPEPTTITITTCENKACGPTTITVSQASTVVITEECLVPSTTPAPKPTTPTTVAGESTARSSTAAVTSYEAGAAQNVAGLALGVVGAVAMLV